MPISPYVESLREVLGSRLLLLPGVAAVIRDGNGRLLLQKRADDGEWSLPAGGIDPGETPAGAVVREVKEETGLDVIPERLTGVFGGADFRHVYPNGDEAEFTVLVFECRVVGGQLQTLDHEAVELRYVPPETMPELTLPYPPELFRAPGPDRPIFQPPDPDSG